MTNGKKPTIKDIAERVGTSTATVHRVIYGKDGVGAKLRQRILDEIESSNFMPDKAASTLRQSKKVIDILIPKPEEEDRFFSAEIWEGIFGAVKEFSQEKVSFRYVDCGYNLQKISKALEELYDSDAGQIHGLITMGDDVEAINWVHRFAKRGVVVALISNIVVDIPGVYVVKASEFCMGAVAARLANLTCGERDARVLVVNGNAPAISCGHYIRSFRDNLNGRYNVDVISGAHLSEYRQEVEEHLLNHAVDFVFACGCRATYNLSVLLEEKKELQKSIVVGSDFFPEIVEYLESEVLTAVINQSIASQGREAVHILVNLLTDLQYSLESSVVELPISVVFKENYSCFLK